jgi:hypothetical protein
MQLLVPSSVEIQMLGSSTIIFGLMGMSLVWAPRNEVTCIIWLRFSPIELDLSILWFGAMYIALDVLTGGMSGVVRASLTNLPPGVIVAMALDHTFGAILGIIVGAAMVKLHLVDCENWDLFAVMERRTGRPRDKEPRTKRANRLVSSEYRPREKRKSRRSDKSGSGGVQSVEDRSTALVHSMRHHLEVGEPEAALAVYHKARRSNPAWNPPEGDWRNLIEGLLGLQLWDDSVVVMRDYIHGPDQPSPRVRLKLAQVLVQNVGRPMQAIKVLGQIPEGSLPEKLETMRRQLTLRAEAMREEGPLELDEDLV